jgi:hypothetical protein
MTKPKKRTLKGSIKASSNKLARRNDSDDEDSNEESEKDKDNVEDQEEEEEQINSETTTVLLNDLCGALIQGHPIDHIPSSKKDLEVG